MTERIKLTEDYILENSHWPPDVTQQILDDTRSMDYYRQWYKEHFPDAGDSLPLLKELFEYRSKLAKYNEKEYLKRVKKLQKIKELVKIESDLDLHPEAEDLKINLEIKRILDKLKEILEE